MKLQTNICTTILALAIGSASISAALDTATVDAKIKFAAENLLKNDKTDEETTGGFRALMDAIALTSSQAGFPAEYSKNIANARKQLASGSILDEKALALLRASYLMINSGKAFQMPAAISSIEQATEWARKQLNIARASLKQGKADQCSKILLEVVLMVVTPMQ